MGAMRGGVNETSGRRAGRVQRAPLFVFPLIAILLGGIDGVLAQGIAPIETPYTLIDDERRTLIEAGASSPLRGNGPVAGYAYLFLTRPSFLKEDLYLRALVAPGFVTGELIRNHLPTENSALGFGGGGGLFAADHQSFRDGRFEKEQSFSGNLVRARLVYYLRGPKVADLLPLEAQIRVQPTYVTYHRDDDTSRRFRLPEDSAIYRMRAGVRVGGVPPDLFPELAAELSLWHELSYRQNAGRFGLPERPQQTKHLTQKTWMRLGGIYSFRGTQASAFLNAGIAEDSDPLSAFRLGGSLRLRAEFPLLLHGYNVDEIFARRFWLVNLGYRFPIWPGQDRAKLQVVADYAQVDFISGRGLPRNHLAGVGANLSVDLTKRMTVAAGYGYGIDAPRGGGFGSHEVSTLFEFKF